MCDLEVSIILMSLSLWSGQNASWLQCVSFICHFLLSTSPLNLFHHLSPASLPLSIPYPAIFPFSLFCSLPVLYHLLFPPLLLVFSSCILSFFPLPHLVISSASLLLPFLPFLLPSIAPLSFPPPPLPAFPPPLLSPVPLLRSFRACCLLSFSQSPGPPDAQVAQVSVPCPGG